MRLIFFIPILVIELLFSFTVTADTQKIVVGATEQVFIGEKNLRLKARIDTGAKTSSVHAENIVINRSNNPEGQSISFDLVNKQGQRERIGTTVDSQVTVKTSEGTEQRYKVWLRVKWRNSSKNILVTLNDRTQMTYALLLGRNWLQGDFIVDVDKNNMD